MVIFASLLRLKNVGEIRSEHDELDVQIWSNGTSGQCEAFAAVSLSSAQSKSADGRHRSAAVNATLAGAAAEGSSFRVPYSIAVNTAARS